MNLSANTLIVALKAVDHEIKRYEKVLETEALDDDTEDAYGQYVLDLSKALGELGEAYGLARQRHPQLPPVDDLLGAA
jgi:hypothetical protein